MNEHQRDYYNLMRSKDRMIVMRDLECNALGFITYYIGDCNEEKYIRDNPWSILEDEPNTGTIAYIDQMITNKDKNNVKLSLDVFNRLKWYLKTKHPQITHIRWNRYKGGKTHVYFESIERCGV